MHHAKTAFRSVVLFAFLGVLLIPAGASAVGRNRPLFAPPPPCQPVRVLPACPPPVHYYYLQTPTLAPPTVKPEPAKPAVPKAEVEPPPTIRPVVASPEPANPPTIPPTNLKFDPIPVPSAVPSPAIPSPALPPAIPGVPDFKPAEGQKVPPIVPPLSIPDLTSSTSKSSPLTGRTKAAVDVYPVDGAAPVSLEALRKVVFFNHADREVKLTLGGKTVTVPRKHSVTAEVPVEFVWRLDEEADRTTKIPVEAPGVDIVIRK